MAGACVSFNALELLQVPRCLRPPNLAPVTACRVGGVRQARRLAAPSSPRVSRPLHASGGHRQPSPDRLRRRQGPLSLEGLPATRAPEGDVPEAQEFMRRSCCMCCRAASTDSALRLPGQSLPAAAKLSRCRELLRRTRPRGVPRQPPRLAYHVDYCDSATQTLLTVKLRWRDCPICGRGHMVCIETFLRCPATWGHHPDDDR